MGSFALSMGFSTSATGRASTAFGVSTKAMGEGEMALGLYTEDSPTSGVVLRVGTGHESRSPLKQDPLHTTHVKHDALRVNADGSLYLRKKGGAAIADVQSCIETLEKNLHQAQEALEVAKAEVAATRSEMMANARNHERERAADHEQLAATNAELAATKQDLTDTKAKLADLESRFNSVLGKLDVFRDVARM